MAVPCHGAGSEAVAHLVAFPISLVGAAAGGLGPPVPTGLGKNNPGGWLGLHGSPRLPGTHTRVSWRVPSPAWQRHACGDVHPGSRPAVSPGGVGVLLVARGRGHSAVPGQHPTSPPTCLPCPCTPCPPVLRVLLSPCPPVLWVHLSPYPLVLLSPCPPVLHTHPSPCPPVLWIHLSLVPVSPCPSYPSVPTSPRPPVPITCVQLSPYPCVPVSPYPPSPSTCPVSPSTPHPLCLLAPHSRVPAPRGATPRGHLGVTSGHWGLLGVTGAVRSSRGASPPGGAVGWAAPLGAALRRGRPTLWYRASERTKWAWRGGAAAIPARGLCSCRAPRPGTAEEEAEIPEIKPRGRSRRFG